MKVQKFLLAGLAVALASEEAEPMDLEDDEVDMGDGGPDGDSMLGLSAEEQQSRMEVIFGKMDTDGDGTVTRAEAEKWALSVDQLAKDVHGAEEFASLDKDDDGFVSLEEMLALYAQYGQTNEADLAVERKYGERRFKAIDANKDGKLETAEVRVLLDPGQNAELVDVEANTIMEAQDKNKDGKIDFSEYADLENRQKPSDAELTAMKKDFEGFDKNLDGGIDMAEVKEVIKNMQSVEIERSLNQVFEGKDALTAAEWEAARSRALVSALTAEGHLLREPHKYPSLALPFEAQPQQDYQDLMGAGGEEKLAELMKQFQQEAADRDQPSPPKDEL